MVALMVLIQMLSMPASASSEVFVGASQKVSFRLMVDNRPQARLVVRFMSSSMRRRIRREKVVVAYCSWPRWGTSVNPIKLGRKTAVAGVLLSHPKSGQPSVCGLRSILKLVKTRDGHFEYLRLVVARMRHVSA
jgi:hypothetical protein